MDNKIIERIKKLFELSRNNPSEEEAKSAALKAQELMAQHGIELTEVEGVTLEKDEKIEEVWVDVPAKKWKYTLAHIVADNFRCKFFMCGRSSFIFYGHETDAHIASETFKYLFNVGNALGNKLYREAKKAGEWTDNVYNSAVMGFCEGIRKALSEQSVALMVVLPEDVKTQYEKRSENFKVSHSSAPHVYNGSAYHKGVEHGYNTMRRKELKG